MSLTERLIIFFLLVIPVMFISMYCTSDQGKEQKTSNKSLPPNAPEKLVLALSPSVEGGQIIELSADFNKILSDHIGIPVETKIIPSYIAAVQGLASGKIDCGMVHPLGYVLGKQKFPLEVILKVKRNDATDYNCQILTRSDSDINTLTDLKGHSFGFVDLTSTSGYLYPRDLLQRNGIDIDKDFSQKPVFAGSHDKVALDILNGILDAGATYQDVRERLVEKNPEIMEKTRVIAVAGPIPNQMFCVTENMDSEFKEYLTRKLIEISKGIEVDGKIVQPFMDYDQIQELLPATDRDYDIVRQVIKNLNIDILAEAMKSQS
jgi:phosphonate transport system substrate-binding protein